MKQLSNLKIETENDQARKNYIQVQCSYFFMDLTLLACKFLQHRIWWTQISQSIYIWMTPLAPGPSLSSQYQRFYSQPSNFSSSPSSLSLLITFTICIEDPKFYSLSFFLFQFSSGDHNGLMTSKAQICLWLNACYQMPYLNKVQLISC